MGIDGIFDVYFRGEFSVIERNETDEALKQEISDKFTPKRESSELLSASYARLGYDGKASRVLDCGTFLEFRLYDGVDKWHLHSANFCRDRLCPLCAWRRTYKVFGQVSQIMDAIGDDYAYLFLTLTVRSCDGEKLASLLDEMQSAFRRFVSYKRIKEAVKGCFKSLEITRNRKNGTYHPHYHCILAVKKSYFTGRDYIKQADWLDFWRKAMNDPLITQVHIQRCRAKEETEGEETVRSLKSAVAEVSKYSVKSVDYIVPDDSALTDDIVFILSAALCGRRLCSFSGVFDKIRKQLSLDDCDNGDLVHIDGDEIRPDVAYMIRRYSWSCGVYKLVEELREVNVEISAEDDPDL